MFLDTLRCAPAFCLLCGATFEESQARRFCDTRKLCALVRDKCKRTPFVFEFLTTLPESVLPPQSPCCLPCLHWRRRLVRNPPPHTHTHTGCGGMSEGVCGGTGVSCISTGAWSAPCCLWTPWPSTCYSQARRARRTLAAFNAS